MSSDIVIKVENLSKCYRIYDQPRDRLLQMFARGRKQYFREFWALKDVSFEVKKGETIGILGRNGSGKSTLLQIICGMLTPTNGTVETFGRIAALLELGSGFNPDFTGRENVYMNASLLGMTKEETDSRFDDIAAFADIGDFIEQPVKTYSSGMYVRLAFAVNIMSQPEIMVVDEALAVGDMNFQAKCMTALTKIQKNGATIFFVSHDVGAVKSLCSRGIYLKNGNLKLIGPAPDIAEHYIRVMREEMNKDHRHLVQTLPVLSSFEKKKWLNRPLRSSDNEFKTSKEFDQRVAQFRYGSGAAKISYAELLNMDDEPIAMVEFNQKIKVKIFFTCDEDLEISPNYYILDDKKNLILGAGPRQLGYPLIQTWENSKHVVIYVTNLPLQEGSYSIQLQLSKPVMVNETAEFLDVIDDAIVFSVDRRKEARIWTKVLLPNIYEAKVL